jgi:hypothetical protein
LIVGKYPPVNVYSLLLKMAQSKSWIYLVYLYFKVVDLSIVFREPKNQAGSLYGGATAELRKLSCGPTPEKLQGCWAGPGLLVPGLDGAMGAMVSGGKIGMVV